MAYVAGKMMVIRALVNDWNLYVVPPASSISLPREVSIEFAAMTPMQVDATLGNGWPDIKKLIIGGAALSAKLKQQLSDLSTQCYETYGMTETLTHVAIKEVSRDPGQHHFNTIGDVSIEIDDRHCLVVRAPHISAAPIVTNDIVELHSDSSFELLGRIDSVINSGGIKLFPLSIESAIADIINVAYYIDKEQDETLGERAVLHLESEPWSQEKKSEWLANIRKLLPSTHIPKAIYFHDRFDRTASGKIKRNL